MTLLKDFPKALTLLLERREYYCQVQKCYFSFCVGILNVILISFSEAFSIMNVLIFQTWIYWMNRWTEAKNCYSKGLTKGN